MRHSKKLIDILTALFIFLFVYAAMSKLMDYEKFVVQISQSPLLTSMAGFIAWFIPGIELITALLLVFPFSRLLGLYTFFALMVLFTGYILIVTQFSDYVPCSCGGVIEYLNWNQHMVFNVVFIIGALLTIVFYSGPSFRNSN